MKKLLIRFNTDHNGSDLKWRVIIDGVEHLASEVIADCQFKTSMNEIAEGVFKHHISVDYNVIEWNGTSVILY